MLGMFVRFPRLAALLEIASALSSALTMSLAILSALSDILASLVEIASALPVTKATLLVRVH